MTWTKTYRTVVALNMLIIFAQFAFAGLFLGGNDSAVAVHGVTGILLILFALVQTALSFVLRAKVGAPFWLIVLNIGLILAEAIEAVCGHNRILSVHVPLAAGVLAGLCWQLFWMFRTATVTESLR